MIDGAKALHTAVGKVFGQHALIQRCTLHKRRNVTGYLGVDERDPVDARLARAFAEPDPAKGRAACDALARQLERDHPDAAASLREGLDEMFTVARLGISGRLRPVGGFGLLAGTVVEPIVMVEVSCDARQGGRVDDGGRTPRVVRRDV